jgi:hypothetical protein
MHSDEVAGKQYTNFLHVMICDEGEYENDKSVY